MLDINPIALQLGPLKIHWYALAYIAGIMLGYMFARMMVRRDPVSSAHITAELLERYTFGHLIFGMILGGRLGHVIFYQPLHFMEHPLEIVMTWKGGMSFHGGLIGVLIASYLFIRKHKIPFFSLMDVAAIATPIGLGLGRLGNFINGELYGRVTDMPWGMVFPGAGDLPRHPAQLYEALAEGLLLFIILGICFTKDKFRLKTGSISGLFLFFYGSFRFIIEFYKDPVAQGSWEGALITHGHLLTLPMIIMGLILFHKSQRAPLDTLPASPR